MKQLPVTPRTPRGTTCSRSSGPQARKVDNFLATLFHDEMTTENWVTTDLDGVTKKINNNLPSLWHQFDFNGELKKLEPKKPVHTNL